MNLYMSRFSDGVLILLMEEVGWWTAERDDFKRGYWSRVEIPTRMQIFFLLIFVYKLTSTIHTIIQIV